MSQNTQFFFLRAPLTNINYDDLINVIDYIYQGEVQIYQECLDRFLLIAQRFKLNGLLANQSKENSQDTVNQKYEQVTQDNSAEVPETKIAIEKTYKENQISFNRSVSIPESSTMEDVRKKVLEYLEKCDNGQTRCKVCGKIMTGTGTNPVQNMKKHIETHLEGISFSCTKCGKQFRSSNSLSVHNTNFHR